MSEIISSQTVEQTPKPDHHLRNRILAGALATGLATGVGLTARQANHNAEQLNQLAQANQAKDQNITDLQDIVAGLTGTSREVVAGKGLKRVEDLPGYGSEVSVSEQARMRAATVKVVARGKQVPEGVPNDWFDNCTGLKVASGASTYVVMAGHCLSLTGSAMKGGGPSFDKAQNVTRNLQYEYGVKPLLPDGSEGDIVPVTAVSQSNDVDMALLKVDSRATSAKDFNAMPAITDYEKRIFNPALVPGESMSVFSLPEASSGKVLMGKGIYLGSIENPVVSGTVLEFVGLRNADMPQHDACNYGASGSSAISAGGHITGPLALRNNIHYAPGSLSNAPDDPAYDIKFFLQLEQSLQLKLGEFNTICGYAAPYGNTVADLEAGFTNPAPRYTAPPTGSYK